jgi:hypothetical protein
MTCIAPGIFVGTTEEWEAEFDNLAYNDPRRRRVYECGSSYESWCPTCGTYMSARSTHGILLAMKTHECKPEAGRSSSHPIPPLRGDA